MRRLSVNGRTSDSSSRPTAGKQVGVICPHTSLLQHEGGVEEGEGGVEEGGGGGSRKKCQ